MAKAPSGKLAGKSLGKPGATPRKMPAPRKSSAPRTKAAAAAPPGRWGARVWGGGPSWIGVAVIVLALLVILPIAAAVLGDIWAVILGALIGGFALGRATAR